MRADYGVVLDACVLIPMPLADTLLRMAETPGLYLPRWSQMIMDEVTRSLIQKWNMPLEKAQRRESELRRHFPEAWIEGFEPLIEAMTNEPEDRHVLAVDALLFAEVFNEAGDVLREGLQEPGQRDANRRGLFMHLAAERGTSQ